jgi:O-antigen/teichoic acid export membrane protein
VQWVYTPKIGVGYVFISNLLASVVTLLLLLPEIFKFSFFFDKALLQKMLNYSFPILIVGMAGILIQQIDKILIPFLIPEEQLPMKQLGIYGAAVKVAVLMNMFIQAFRYAFEPFFFSQAESKNDKNIYAEIMKYFVIFGLLIFLGMMLYIDVIKLIIPLEYEEGFTIVPVVMLANLFFGIYFTLSLWYKLTDMTRYGAYISVLGAVISITLNFVLIPIFGYKGSAAALLTAFFIMMVVSYFLGKKYYPVPYNLKRIGTYFFVAVVIYILGLFSSSQPPIVKYPLNTLFLFGFIFTVYKLEKSQLTRLFSRNMTK